MQDFDFKTSVRISMAEEISQSIIQRINLKEEFKIPKSSEQISSLLPLTN